MAINTDLLDFLKSLEQNNDRDWFNDHKNEFKQLQSDFKVSVDQLFQLMNAHDQIDKQKVFRIYRDVRFSKNKLPYKTHMAASFQRVKPELRGGYYLHVKPKDQSFIAVGFWDPSKDDLHRIRKEFEQDDEEIREIIQNKHLKQVWGTMEGDELKTAPRDFDKEHPAIDLIRKKQFVFTKNFKDAEVVSSNFITQVNEDFKSIRPFFDYMSEVLTTNLNGERLFLG